MGSTKYSIHPDYAAHESTILDFIRNFKTTGSDFVRGERNVLKTFSLEGGRVLNIKSFQRPNIVNRVVYKYFRDPKARRSYDHSKFLISCGIRVPQPVAYLENYDGYSIRDSYYVSEQLFPDLHFDQVVQRPELPEYEAIMCGFTNLALQLHDHGVEFKDFSPGNILIENKNGEFVFYLVDLNRMAFHEQLVLRRRLSNFQRLPLVTQMIAIISREYAGKTNQPEAELFKEIYTAIKKFSLKFGLRRRLKFWNLFYHKSKARKSNPVYDNLDPTIWPHAHDTKKDHQQRTALANEPAHRKHW